LVEVGVDRGKERFALIVRFFFALNSAWANVV
jgi:hypothetical protein